MLLTSLITLLPLLAAPALAQDGGDFDEFGLDFSRNQMLKLEQIGVYKTPLRKQMRVASRFGPHCFTQKRSHFDGSTETFCQQYLVNSDNYKPGGPVIILDNGESPSLNAKTMDKQSLASLLAKETNGIYVKLEHRYYGGSNVTEDLSTDNLRWLNVRESLEDSAEFIRNFPVPDGLELPEPDLLTPSKTPFLYIGGSYPGGKANWMRKHYPDLVWGSIGSSAVIHATVDFPDYFDTVVRHGEPECVAAITESIAAVDKLLEDPKTNGAAKALFGYKKELKNWTFGNIMVNFYGWQTRRWNAPTDQWRQFCGNMTEAALQGQVTVEGLEAPIPAALQRWGDLSKADIQRRLAEGQTVSNIIEGLDHPAPDAVDLDQTWRLWEFQTCTEWGYGFSSPKDPNAPRAISKFVTSEEYRKNNCQGDYKPGEHFQIPEFADVDKINSLGDYPIAADRMATVDGEWDPWRTMSVAAETQPVRQDSITRPYRIIPKGSHCWDFATWDDITKEPKDIREVHEWELNFVKAWIQQFHDEKNGNSTTVPEEERDNGKGNGKGNGHGNGKGNGNGNGNGNGTGNDKGNGNGKRRLSFE